MYKNVGKKICVLARLFGIIGLIEVVVGFILLSPALEGEMFIGMPFIFLGGGVVLFMSSWLVFGFGQLVDDVHSFRFGNKTENDKERIGFENSSNMEESKIEELEYYKKLLDSGKITEEEFVNIEKMIIGQ